MLSRRRKTPFGRSSVRKGVYRKPWLGFVPNRKEYVPTAAPAAPPAAMEVYVNVVGL